MPNERSIMFALLMCILAGVLCQKVYHTSDAATLFITLAALAAGLYIGHKV